VSDSFADLWTPLAAECGLALLAVDDVAALAAARATVGLVAGGGVEEELENVIRRASVTPPLEIAAVGALPSHRVAARVVAAGAAEYFALPGDLELMRSWLRERADRTRDGARRTAFAARESAKYRFDGILGSSPALLTALERAARVIPHANVTVLITGETGTGKELLARAIHYNGPRREAPFVDVNCAAIPENLLESELFGHEKGSFTGATSAKPGLFEVANGGTIFLDEIGHLPLTLQGKLLRALQERHMRRVGGTRAIAVDVRVMAATHVDLAAAVRRGAFREDLYFRLNVVPVELPPLRARRDDIVPLARHFVERFATEYGLPMPALTPAAEAALRGREWSGNVRELRNAIERALLLAGPVVDAADVAADQPRDAAEGGMSSGSAVPFPAPLTEVIRGAVTATLEMVGGNKSEAARRLKISRPRLQRILEGKEGSDEDASE